MVGFFRQIRGPYPGVRTGRVKSNHPAVENILIDLVVGLFDRSTEGAIGFPAFAPMGQHLPRRGTVSDPAQLSRLARCHVVEDMFHGLTVWQGALEHDELQCGF